LLLVPFVETSFGSHRLKTSSNFSSLSGFISCYVLFARELFCSHCAINIFNLLNETGFLEAMDKESFDCLMNNMVSSTDNKTPS
jgi:hypothetical protein